MLLLDHTEEVSYLLTNYSVSSLIKHPIETPESIYSHLLSQFFITSKLSIFNLRLFSLPVNIIKALLCTVLHVSHTFKGGFPYNCYNCKKKRKLDFRVFSHRV